MIKNAFNSGDAVEVENYEIENRVVSQSRLK